MADLTVNPADLALFLDVTVDTARAQLMLDLAQQECSIVLTPLPDTAKAVVLSVAARGYLNPQGNSTETVGQWSSQQMGGIFLLRAERQSLLRLAGRGGAFTVDPTPSDAGTYLPPWDRNVFWPNGVPLVDETP